MIKRIKINAKILYLICAFTFLGYYAVLLLVHSAGMSANSRVVTIPLRLMLSTLCVSLLFCNIKLLRSSWELRIFNLFSILYIGRMFLDEINNNVYFIPIFVVLLYYVSFVYLPFNSIVSIRFNPKYNKTIFKAFALTGFIFSFLVIIFYSKFIGSTHRLSSTYEEEILSPLSLSYCSAIILGAFPIAYFNFRLSSLWRTIVLLSFTLSFVPLFLGASRGSFLAIFIPYFIFLIARNSIKKVITGLILLTLFIFLLYSLQDYLGTALFDRFLNLEEDIESNSNSAARMDIWKSAFNQFVNSPLIGDKMSVKNFNGYAHNFFIEVLQSTGILGFIPFFALIAKGFVVSYNIFKSHLQYAWIAIIFIQCLMQGMVTGAIWSASWLFISMALLFIINNYLTENSLNKNRTRY